MSRQRKQEHVDEREQDLALTFQRLVAKREAAEHAVMHAKEALKFAQVQGGFFIADSVVHAIHLAIYALEHHLAAAKRLESGAARHLGREA